MCPTGLVLEGGAMRGLFSCGVMDVLQQAGVRFDGIVGVSAGAAFGCNYKSGQTGRALRYNQRFARDSRYCSLWSLIRCGNLFHSEFAYHTVPMLYDPFDGAAFEADATAYHLVATDVDTGESVYKVLERFDREALEWIRASCGMPIVSTPVLLDGRRLLDGGITDSIPLRYFEQQGYKRNVVILTQPDGYVKKPLRMRPLLRLLLCRKPKVWAAMQARPAMYNAQLAYVRERENAGAALVIRPDNALPIGHVCHDPAQMQTVYDLGRQKGEEMMEAVKSFLQQTK